MDNQTNLPYLSNENNIADYSSFIKGSDVGNNESEVSALNERIYKGLETVSPLFRDEFAHSLEKITKNFEFKRLELVLRFITAINDKNLDALEYLVKGEEIENQDRKSRKERIK